MGVFEQTIQQVSGKQRGEANSPLDFCPELVYYIITMKHTAKRPNKKQLRPVEVIRKVRNRMRDSEVYYNNSAWQIKEIDGAVFLPVSRVDPESNQNVTIFYMKKDSLEYIK
jgi:hypothetical protein